MNTRHVGTRRRRGRPAVVAGLVALALMVGWARPAAAVPEISPLPHVLDSANALVATLQAEGAKKKVLKVATKMVTKLQVAEAGDSYLEKVKALTFSARTFERKFRSHAALGAALLVARDDVTATLEGARADAGLRVPAIGPVGIVAVPASGPIGKRRVDPVKVAQKVVDKSAKYLDKADAIPPGVKNALTKQFAQLEKAAKILDDAMREREGRTKNWVVSDLALADASSGFDMNGDGTPDNAAAALASTIDGLPGIDQDQVEALLRAQLVGERSQAVVPIIQMWGFQSFSNDPLVLGGLLNGVDLDDDTSDNFSGTEVFDVSQSTAPDGHPYIRALTSFDAGGNYSFIVDGSRASSLPVPEEFQFAGLTLPGDVPFGVVGQASEPTNTGVIGFALPVARVLTFLDAEMPIPIPTAVRNQIQALADLDVDGDGTSESLSTVFAFTAVSCEITLDSVDSTEIVYVVSELAVAASSDGHDYNGDQVPDNALSLLETQLEAQFPLIAAQVDLDQILTDRLAASDRVFLINMWGIQSFDYDPAIFAGIVTGSDLDGNPADNFSGSEPFDPGVGMASDGHPIVRAPLSLGPTPPGSYGVDFQGDYLEIVGVPISPDAFIYLDGVATPTGTSGTMAFAISPSNLAALIDAEVSGSLPQGVIDLIAGLADVSSGGGPPDLISVAIDYVAVTAAFAP